MFKKSTFEPAVWATPTFLLILNPLLSGNTSNTWAVSVTIVFPEPILIELPDETILGMSVRKISCIKPPLSPIVIGDAKVTLWVDTPTLYVPAKLNISVLNPDNLRLSWSFTSINGRKLATTSVVDSHFRTAFSKEVICVSILEIPIPTISLTSAVNPEPFVSSSSNTVKSPTLYPSPPLNISIPSTPPFVTDSTFDICLTSS